VHYLSENVKGKYATIGTQVHNEGRVIAVNYKLVNQAGEWRVYDFQIEGISMVRNYRARISQWLRSNSVERLLNQLQRQAA